MIWGKYEGSLGSILLCNTKIKTFMVGFSPDSPRTPAIARIGCSLSCKDLGGGVSKQRELFYVRKS